MKRKKPAKQPTKLKLKAKPKIKAELTAQEKAVFELIVQKGSSNAEVAKALKITERTAKFHSGNLLRKMGEPDRLKLAVSHWRSVTR